VCPENSLSIFEKFFVSFAARPLGNEFPGSKSEVLTFFGKKWKELTQSRQDATRNRKGKTLASLACECSSGASGLIHEQISLALL